MNLVMLVGLTAKNGDEFASMLIRNYNYSGQKAVERFVKIFGDECIIWDRIIATVGNIEATNIPATFQVQLKEFYTNPQTGNNIIWTNANATEHMGEYVAGFGGENFSANLRSQLMLEIIYHHLTKR